MPRLAEPGLDGRVAGFALGVALLTSLLVGALPASGAVRDDLRASLQHAGRTGGGHGQRRLRERLVVAQLALAVALLVGAGLMLRSLARLQAVDPGFATRSVWTVPLQLPGARYPEPWQKVVFQYRVLERVAAIPGVVATGTTNITPFGSWNFVNDVTPEDRAAEAPTSGLLQAAWRAVSPGYFEAAGVPLLAGRGFGSDDRDGRLPVAIVSRSLAARLWPGEQAVGKRLYWGGTTGTPKTVVGVTGDIRDFTLDAEPLPTLFLPIGQVAWPSMTLVVRAREDVAGMEGAVRRAVWAQDPGLPVPEVLPVAARRATALAGPRLHALLLASFAAAALLLAAVGVYGVLAFAVAQRRREIAVRLALGAEPRQVLRMLMRRGLALAGIGAAIGLAGALALGQLMEGLLFETPAGDPVTLLAVPAVLAAVGLLATALPARRAARTDPMLALRQE
jgi:predicted permease